MSSLYELCHFEKIHFSPLCEYGYFVSCSRRESGEGESGSKKIIVDCILYFTDFDEETGAYTLLRISPSNPLYQDGVCVGCGNGDNQTNTEWKRGSIACPCCGEWTRPWVMKKKEFRGMFKLNPGNAATFVPLESDSSLPEGVSQISSEHMISAISEALRTAHLYDF
jgi:hypothetical protein